MSERWALQLCHSHYGPFADVARQYAEVLKRAGFRVLTAYLTGAADERVRLRSASDEVVFLGFSSRAVGGLKIDAIRAVRRLCGYRHFGLVVAHRFKPIYIACLATRLPVIGVHHAFGDYARRGRRVFAGLFQRRLTLLGVSDAVREDIRQSLPSWPSSRIRTLHNRIDVDAIKAGLLTREQARQLLRLPADAFVVANVGRLHPDKDQATLIRGFAHALPGLPEGAILAIAGSGPLEQALKVLAGTMDVAESVRFLGQVPDIWKAFPAFDVFALSSDHEPFGMVLLEAMAAGVPVVATNCGGAPEVVGELGGLFALGDEQGLAERLGEIALIGDKDRRLYAKRAELRLRERFSDDAAAAVFAGILKDVLGDG